MRRHIKALARKTLALALIACTAGDPLVRADPPRLDDVRSWTSDPSAPMDLLLDERREFNRVSATCQRRPDCIREQMLRIVHEARSLRHRGRSGWLPQIRAVIPASCSVGEARGRAICEAAALRDLHACMNRAIAGQAGAGGGCTASGLQHLNAALARYQVDQCGRPDGSEWRSCVQQADQRFVENLAGSFDSAARAARQIKLAAALNYSCSERIGSACASAEDLDRLLATGVRSAGGAQGGGAGDGRGGRSGSGASAGSGSGIAGAGSGAGGDDDSTQGPGDGAGRGTRRGDGRGRRRRVAGRADSGTSPARDEDGRGRRRRDGERPSPDASPSEQEGREDREGLTGQGSADGSTQATGLGLGAGRGGDQFSPIDAYSEDEISRDLSCPSYIQGNPSCIPPPGAPADEPAIDAAVTDAGAAARQLESGAGAPAFNEANLYEAITKQMIRQRLHGLRELASRPGPLGFGILTRLHQLEDACSATSSYSWVIRREIAAIRAEAVRADRERTDRQIAGRRLEDRPTYDQESLDGVRAGLSILNEIDSSIATLQRDFYDPSRGPEGTLADLQESMNHGWGQALPCQTVIRTGLGVAAFAQMQRGSHGACRLRRVGGVPVIQAYDDPLTYAAPSTVQRRITCDFDAPTVEACRQSCRYEEGEVMGSPSEADQLVACQRVPRVDATGQVARDGFGLSDQSSGTEFTSLLRETSTPHERCQAKWQLLNAQLARRAAVLARYPELLEFERGPNEQEDAILRSRLSDASDQMIRELLGDNGLEGNLRQMCENPDDTAESAMADPDMMRQLMSCGGRYELPVPSRNDRSLFDPEAEFDCRFLRGNAHRMCGIIHRVSYQQERNRVWGQLLGQAGEGLLAGVDVAACVTLMGSVGTSVARSGLSGAARSLGHAMMSETLAMVSSPGAAAVSTATIGGMTGLGYGMQQYGTSQMRAQLRDRASRCLTGDGTACEGLDELRNQVETMENASFAQAAGYAIAGAIIPMRVGGQLTPIRQQWAEAVESYSRTLARVRQLTRSGASERALQTALREADEAATRLDQSGAALREQFRRQAGDVDTIGVRRQDGTVVQVRVDEAPPELLARVIAESQGSTAARVAEGTIEPRAGPRGPEPSDDGSRFGRGPGSEGPADIPTTRQPQEPAVVVRPIREVGAPAEIPPTRAGTDDSALAIRRRDGVEGSDASTGRGGSRSDHREQSLPPAARRKAEAARTDLAWSERIPREAVPESRIGEAIEVRGYHPARHGADSEVYVVDLSDGTQRYFRPTRPIDGAATRGRTTATVARRTHAAAQLNGLLGIDTMPATRPARLRIGGEVFEGILSDAAPGRPPGNRGFRERIRLNLEQEANVAAFEWFIGNPDVHLQNFHIDDHGRIRVFDHSRAFEGNVHSSYRPYGLRPPEYITPEFARGIRALTPERIRSELGQVLTRSEIDDLIARRQRLIEILDDPIRPSGPTVPRTAAYRDGGAPPRGSHPEPPRVEMPPPVGAVDAGEGFLGVHRHDGAVDSAPRTGRAGRAGHAGRGPLPQEEFRVLGTRAPEEVLGGMRAGDEISWTGPDGQPVRLTFDSFDEVSGTLTVIRDRRRVQMFLEDFVDEVGEGTFRVSRSGQGRSVNFDMPATRYPRFERMVTRLRERYGAQVTHGQEGAEEIRRIMAAHGITDRAQFPDGIFQPGRPPDGRPRIILNEGATVADFMHEARHLRQWEDAVRGSGGALGEVARLSQAADPASPMRRLSFYLDEVEASIYNRYLNALTENGRGVAHFTGLIDEELAQARRLADSLTGREREAADRAIAALEQRRRAGDAQLADMAAHGNEAARVPAGRVGDGAAAPRDTSDVRRVDRPADTTAQSAAPTAASASRSVASSTRPGNLPPECMVCGEEIHFTNYTRQHAGQHFTAGDPSTSSAEALRLAREQSGTSVFAPGMTPEQIFESVFPANPTGTGTPPARLQLDQRARELLDGLPPGARQLSEDGINTVALEAAVQLAHPTHPGEYRVRVVVCGAPRCVDGSEIFHQGDVVSLIPICGPGVMSIPKLSHLQQFLQRSPAAASAAPTSYSSRARVRPQPCH